MTTDQQGQDQQWVRDWFGRFDRGARYDAISELRLNAEKEVVNLNRDLGERLREFARAVLEVYAFLGAEETPSDMEQRMQRAKALEHELREMEETLDRKRKEFEAFERLERQVSRG